jgi:RimJ/RimL family protein N-acetyltransferase
MIETERLILRKVDAKRDFEAWAECMGNAQTVRYLGTKPMNRAEAWRHMAAIIGHWEIRGYGFFSLEDKETGDWVGRVGPWNPEGWPAPEVGWTISPNHLRKGYASEAARAAVNYAFTTLGWSAVSHVILDGNVGSIGVAEKIGSKFIRTQDGIPGLIEEKVHVYGQTRP